MARDERYAEDLPGPAPGARLRVKAVPGSRVDGVVGALGARLKVKVVAPPEGGRANRALIELLARELGIAPRAIEITAGHGSAEKTLEVRGVAASTIIDKWPAP